MGKKFNLPVSLAVALTVCLLLITGTVVWQKYGADRLTSQDLARLPGVASVQVTPPARHENVPTVVVNLAPTDNLRLAYLQIKRESDRLWGPGEYKLVIADQRDALLQHAEDVVSFSVQQARQTGQWRDLPSAVAAVAAPLGVTAQCYVDNDNVYLALTAGQGYLYEVIAR